MAFFKKIKQLFSKKKSLENKEDGVLNKHSYVSIDENQTNEILPKNFN